MTRKTLPSGLVVAIEHPKGSVRRGTASDGTSWEREMSADYGEIVGMVTYSLAPDGPKTTDLTDVKGADGEPIDIFIGDNPEQFQTLFVIDQVSPKTGLFDELKVVTGVADEAAARALYFAHYPEGWLGFGAVRELFVCDLVSFLSDPARPSHPASLPYRNASSSNSLPDGDAAASSDPICPECGVAMEWGGDKCNRCGAAQEPVPYDNAPEAAQKKAAALNRGKFGDAARKSVRKEGDTLDPLTKCPDCGASVMIYSEDRTPCPECGKVPSSNHFDSAVSDSVSGPFEEVFAGDVVILSGGDAASGRPLRVRQYAMQADARNKNDRIYPRAVVQSAIDTVRPLVRAGSVQSELEHPKAVQTDDGQAFVDNGPARKTGRVIDVIGVDSSGRVYVDREILDTPAGRRVADRIRSGKPYGISTRFKMRGRAKRLASGDTVIVADEMEISTWDDVEHPAVDGAGHQFQLLTDSQLAEIGIPQAGHSPAPGQRRERSTRVKDAIRKKIGALLAAAASGANVEDLNLRRVEIANHIRLAGDSGEDVGDVAQEALRADATMVSIQGYTAGRPAPKGVMGNDLGEGGGEGPFRDVSGARPQGGGAGGDNKPEDKPTGDGLTDAERDRLRSILGQHDQAAADAQRERDVDAAIEAAQADALKGVPEAARAFIVDAVRKGKPTPEQVPGLLASTADGYMKLAADERLRGMGMFGGGSGEKPKGNTTDDAATRITDVRERPSRYTPVVETLLAQMDSYARSNPNVDVDPDSSLTQSIRKFNRPIAEKIVSEWFAQRDGAETPEQFRAKLLAGGDSLQAVTDSEEKAVRGAMAAMVARADSTTISSFYNQPSIAPALLIQAFQDMQAMQFVETIGPGGGSGAQWFNTGNGGPMHVGTVLRVASEIFNDVTTGYGAYGPQEDMLYQTPEDTGIEEITLSTYWQPYAPTWKRLGASITHDVITAMGHGPLNYPVLARHLFHIAYAKQRRVDKALLNEMLNASDEYGAVAVSGQTLNNTNNSVYNASGSLSVNLNPTKTAAATIAATDPSVTYGTNVIGALRFHSGSAGTASPYAGTSGGTRPIVLPRTVTDLDAAGAISTTTKNPISVSAPGSAVRGYLDNDGNVASFPGTTATYAVDFNNGVICFASGVTGSSGLVTTTVTVSYSYVTNYDEFIVNNPTLPTGVTTEQYLSGLLGQHDVTAARMGAAPRFAAPNMAIMSLAAATNITRASIFYKFNSPDGTSLFPTESFFYQRTGVMGARINAPWRVGDTRILFGRKGTTKYGVAVPFEMRGPYPAYDSNGKIKGKDIFYGEENSVIASPQVTNGSGVVVNPGYRSLILR